MIVSKYEDYFAIVVALALFATLIVVVDDAIEDYKKKLGEELVRSIVNDLNSS